MQKKIRTDDKNIKDHCHFTRKYRGVVVSVCNTNYRATKEIPVI